MTLPGVEKLLEVFDQKRQTDLGASETQLFRAHALEELVPGLITAFPNVTTWAGRNAILFRLIRFARSRPEVVALAVRALPDPAYMVRMQACATLAYSLRTDVVPHLELLLEHQSEKTRNDAAAAIDAIRRQNHHYWIDRDHSDSCFWEVDSS